MSGTHDRSRKPGLLPQTDWGHLRRLKGATVPEQASLLEILAENYWTPIFHYLVCQGHSEPEAQDLLQDFFAFALASRLFTKADEQRGRFRSFLLRSLNNFTANERRKQAARKRRPEQGVASLDELVDDDYYQPKALVDAETPERLFHRSWLREVVRNVLVSMERDFRGSGKTTHYLLFESRVVRPELEGVAPPPLGEQAKELGLEFKEAANQVITAKRAFMRLLAKEVRSYVGSEVDASEEQRDVLRLVGLEGGN